MAIALTLGGTASTTTRVNVRHGTPTTDAPIARILEAGTAVVFDAIVDGQAVSKNPHWYRIGSDDFVWAGACTAPRAAAATADDVPPAVAPSMANGLEATPAGPTMRGLDPTFADRLGRLLDACRARGLDFRISQGLRTPQVQALYYCQWAQRTPAMILATADGLDAHGAPWTAALVRSLAYVARRPGWQTSQLPGSGWHQWGEAADCYCYRDGRLVADGNDPAYRTYAGLATDLGLTAGFFFKTHQDSGHVQLRAAAGATDVYGWPAIDEAMRTRFGDKPSVRDEP